MKISADKWFQKQRLEHARRKTACSGIVRCPARGHRGGRTRVRLPKVLRVLPLDLRDSGSKDWTRRVELEARAQQRVDGGFVAADGKVRTDVQLDLVTLAELSRIAREEYGLGGAVQHGASTLPPAAFDAFPKAGACEIHLATDFQNQVYEHSRFPASLKQEMYEVLGRRFAGNDLSASAMAVASERLARFEPPAMHVQESAPEAVEERKAPPTLSRPAPVGSRGGSRAPAAG